MFVCTIHPVRKRPKTCEFCRAEIEEKTGKKIDVEAPNLPSKPIKSSKTSASINITKLTSVGANIASSGLPEFELTISTKEQIKTFIKNEVRKEIANSLSDVLTEEAITEAKKTAGNVFEKAYDLYTSKIKPLSRIQWEHLYVPLTEFNVAFMAKMQNEGWVFKEMFRGKIADICSSGKEVAVLTRVCNEDWPEKPEFNQKGNNDD